MLSNDQQIHNDKFNKYSDMSLDYFIESWNIKGIDKEITLLYYKKYWEKAVYHLKKTFN